MTRQSGPRTGGCGWLKGGAARCGARVGLWAPPRPLSRPVAAVRIEGDPLSEEGAGGRREEAAAAAAVQHQGSRGEESAGCPRARRGSHPFPRALPMPRGGKGIRLLL